MRGCGQVLARGYAEGLRSTLAVHVPELYTQPRLSPRLRQPWVLVRKDSGRLSSVRVAWVPLSCGAIGRASCRERVCQYVEISVVAVSLKKKITNMHNSYT